MQPSTNAITPQVLMLCLVVVSASPAAEPKKQTHTYKTAVGSPAAATAYA